MSEVLGFAEIIEIEEDIIELSDCLKDGLELDSSISRDMRGTLKVNLDVLRRRIEKTLQML
jgi:hypothetical protein